VAIILAYVVLPVPANNQDPRLNGSGGPGRAGAGDPRISPYLSAGTDPGMNLLTVVEYITSDPAHRPRSTEGRLALVDRQQMGSVR
jgi:hypothetical protein